MKKHRPRPRKPQNRKAPPAREAAATAVVDAEEPHGDGAYYHGGAGWLGVGDYILPRGLTGDQGSRADWPKEYFEAAGVPEDYEDGDYVFISTNFKLAVRRAVLHRSKHGRVYKVLPEGNVEPDPARVADCFRCPRAKIVAIKTIPYQLAQRIRAENPRNFEEAADDFERCVEDGAATARRAQEDAVMAARDLVREKVGEICATDLSSRFIATELLAHSLRMLFPAHDIEFTRMLAAKHWEVVFQSMPQSA